MPKTPSAPPRDCRFAIVDLETTGLKADSDHILQMAVVHQDATGQPLSEWSSYVRPPRRWRTPLGPVEIHGITRRRVAFAPTLAEAFATFTSLTRGCILVAHNASFDLGFLRAASARTGIPLEHEGSLCTLHLSRQLGERGQASHKLATLCAEFGIDPGRAHDALHDARATGAVLTHLTSRLGLETSDELDRHVRS